MERQADDAKTPHALSGRRGVGDLSHAADPRGAVVLPIPSSAVRSTLASGDRERESLATYWTFYWAVAAAQLARWLPRQPSRVLDLSAPLGPQPPPAVPSPSAAQAARAGHTVIEVLESQPRSQDPRAGVSPVVADPASLAFLGEGSIDVAVAERRVLSQHLVTEDVLAGIARALRPGGRALLCVDSLVLGMAILAEQNYWAHLSDVPNAEVVLVPWPDGTISRCFGPEQLRELITDADLEVEWIRPRTSLSPSTVEHVLATDPAALSRLVRAELNAPMSEESVGIHLVASARRA